MAQLDLFGETYTVPEPIERSPSEYHEGKRPARTVKQPADRSAPKASNLRNPGARFTV